MPDPELPTAKGVFNIATNSPVGMLVIPSPIWLKKLALIWVNDDDGKPDVVLRYVKNISLNIEAVR